MRPSLGGGNISVSTDCEDCEFLFSSGDYSVHLHNDGSWWVVDTVNAVGSDAMALLSYRVSI